MLSICICVNEGGDACLYLCVPVCLCLCARSSLRLHLSWNISGLPRCGGLSPHHTWGASGWCPHPPVYWWFGAGSSGMYWLPPGEGLLGPGHTLLWRSRRHVCFFQQVIKNIFSVFSLSLSHLLYFPFTLLLLTLFLTVFPSSFCICPTVLSVLIVITLKKKLVSAQAQWLFSVSCFSTCCRSSCQQVLNLKLWPIDTVRLYFWGLLQHFLLSLVCIHAFFCDHELWVLMMEWGSS